MALKCSIGGKSRIMSAHAEARAKGVGSRYYPPQAETTPDPFFSSGCFASRREIGYSLATNGCRWSLAGKMKNRRK